MIMTKMYHTEPYGLSGNDDFGQMSAWYVFNALGFYPVCPGSDRYFIGSPSVTKAQIEIEKGRFFTIIVNNQSEKNVYIQKILLNGKKLDRLYITHNEIIMGGDLIFFMGEKPKK